MHKVYWRTATIMGPLFVKKTQTLNWYIQIALYLYISGFQTIAHKIETKKRDCGCIFVPVLSLSGTLLPEIITINWWLYCVQPH